MYKNNKPFCSKWTIAGFPVGKGALRGIKDEKRKWLPTSKVESAQTKSRFLFLMYSISFTFAVGLKCSNDEWSDSFFPSKENNLLNEATTLTDEDIDKIVDKLKKDDGSKSNKAIISMVANALNRMTYANANPNGLILLVAGLQILDLAGNDSGLQSIARRVIYTGMSLNKRGK